MSQCVRLGKKKITFFGCKDCDPLRKKAKKLRPNNKFCDPECRKYVLLLNSSDGVDLPPDPNDQMNALKNRIEFLENQVSQLQQGAQKRCY